jgi:indolepyruvate ferredoxin oxidoreductase beta subunit
VKENCKILVAGVGGQGIVYLTNLISEAAVLAGIPVKVSEIHGLSQRGGIVTSGIGLGENCTGFVGTANVDLLLGLEALETQRCVNHLHTDSTVIFGDSTIAPYAVSAETADYPLVERFVAFLRSQIRQVIYVKEFPRGLQALYYNIYLLGIACHLNILPFRQSIIEQAIMNIVSEFQQHKTLAAFHAGLEYIPNEQPV